MADTLSHCILSEIQAELLDEAVVKIIMKTAKEIEERYDIEFEQIGCDKDHVHILCRAHPKIALGQMRYADFQGVKSLINVVVQIRSYIYPI